MGKLKRSVERSKLERVMWELGLSHEMVAMEAAKTRPTQMMSRSTIHNLIIGVISEPARTDVTQAVIRLAAEKGITLAEGDLW